MRLIDYLRGLGLSNKDAKAALSSGKVYVRDVPTADAAREVATGEITLRRSAPRVKPWREPVVVWHDDDLAIVAKPAAMLSVPAESRRREPSVLGFVRRVLGHALAVHRLDRDTSGLIMVARNERAQAALKNLLGVHDVTRHYLAITSGVFPEESVRHETFLVRDRGDGRRGSRDDPSGKRAVGEYERVRRLGPGRSLVLARLETGRTHQIRIHLSELGYPVLGDRVYANKALWRASPRLALHSYVLGFRHPRSGESMRFVAPLADDLERLQRQIENGR